MRKIFRISLNTSIIFIIALGMLVSPAAAAQPAQSAKTLSQFTSAGKALSFAPDAVSIAVGSNVYHVQFVGAAQTTPTAENTAGDLSQAATLGRVTYSNLWPGVTLSYDAPAGAVLRSTYHIQPHADPARIRLAYNHPIKIAADGQLLIEMDSTILRESAPVAWQMVDGTAQPVQVAFKLISDPANEQQLVGFELGPYYPDLPLTIDPSLVWNSFFSSSFSRVQATAIDPTGQYIYAVGYSLSTWGTPLNPFQGSWDITIAKFDTGMNLLWHTFLGSGNYNIARDVDIDANGDIYITGDSRESWGTPKNPFSGTTSSDAFVAKLDSNGTLVWNTFLGGVGSSNASFEITVSSDDIFIAGTTSNASWGNPINTYPANYTNGFVAKLNKTTHNRTWHIFFGGGGNPASIYFNTVDIQGLGIDSSGNVYVGGRSGAYSFTGFGSPKQERSDDRLFDGYVLKFNTNGAFQWYTFVGGLGNDVVRGFDVDSSGNSFIAGSSPKSWGSPINAWSDGSQWYVARVNSNGSLTWNTFLQNDSGGNFKQLDLDPSSNVYIVGTYNQSWGSPDPNMPYTGGTDGQILALNSSGALQWHGFLGGASSDGVDTLTVKDADTIYIFGTSNATWGSPLQPWSASNKNFIARVGLANRAPTDISLSNNSIAENEPANSVVGSFTTTDPDTGNMFTYSLVSGTGSTDNDSFNISGSSLRASASFDYETKTSYTIRIRSTDQSGLWTEKPFTVSVIDVNDNAAPTDIALSKANIDENQAINTAVGTLSSTDPDSGNTFTYTLAIGAGGTDNASFNISGSSLRSSAIFDYETRNSYSVRVRSTDQGGLWFEKAFTITINNLVEDSTTSISSVLPEPSALNQAYAITVIVAPSSGGGTPTGSVSVGDGAASCPITLSAGTGSCNLTSTTAGGKTLKANYGGDANFNASSTTTSHSVNKADASVTTWPTASAINYGKTLADSTLSGGAATPAGSFAFTTPSTAPDAGVALQGVTFTPTDTANYNPVTGTASVTVNVIDQAALIVVATPSTVAYGSTSALSTTGGGGTGAVTYSAGASTGCSVTGSTLSVTDASGTCAVTATKAADNNYNSATSAAITVTLTTTDQASLTVVPTPSTVAYGSTSVLSTTGGNGTGAVTYSAGTSTGCSVTGSTLSVTDASGTCAVTATRAADNNYNSATSTAITVTLTTIDQVSLTVVATPSTVAYGSTSVLSSTGGDGTGAVTYSAGTSTGCSVTGSTLSVTDASGTCKITATKAADKNYNETTSAALTLTLTRADSSVTTWPTAGAITYGQTLADSTLSGGAATPAGSFAFTTPATAPDAGAALQGVTFTPTDTVNYKPATGTVSVPVDKSTTLITFDPAPTPVYLGEFTVNATTTNTDSAALTYSKVSGACAWVSGATFSATGADLCVVRAAGAASSNFEAASQTQNISIGKAEPTITWAGPADIVYGTVLGGAQLNATAGTPGSFVYTPAAGIVLTVGAHTLHVDFTPTDALNYSSASKDVSINIGVPPAPTITGISLDIGPTSGGSIVVITGAYLTGGTVTFGGAAAVCSVDSGTQMTCTTPAHNAGNVSIEITTPGGPSAPNSLFTYIQPVNPGLSPNFGPGAGGATVIISGAGFTGSSTATFGGSPAACSFVSSTQISCVTAAHAAGLVDVIVTTGASVLAAPDGYTYLPAPVPGVSPSSGSSAGGTTVIITGSGFDGTTRVSFGGTSADCTWISATKMSCVTPAHAGGSVDIVITGAGAATLAGAFTYIQPDFYADIAPNYGPISGGTTVTITASSGTNFTGTTAVSFGGANAASFMVISATQISAVTPAHAAGMVDIVVSAPAGTFTYARSFSFYSSTLPLALTSTPPNGSFRIARESPAKLIVTFNMDILHVSSTDPGWPSSGTNPANYLLVSAGVNGVIDTQTCLVGAQGDDVLVIINDVSYTPASFTAEISVNNGIALPVGSYQLLVCGTTSIRSLAGVKLNGGLDDARFTFVITTNPAKPALLPATGFAPGQVTSLPAQSQAYTAMSDFWLEIPAIDVKTDIVGVPQSNGSWDVTWLGNDAGYLDGSAYPTHTGNSVMTGHVWEANNLPGPFINLKKLSYGDQIKIHAFGQVYTYEIRENKLVDPANIAALMQHEELAWVTLVTCESYNSSKDSYAYRRLVRAVLISVK